jgi:hypothetical protein
LPTRWRRRTGPVVHARLMGKHAVALRGPDAIAFFYDEGNVRRVLGRVLDEDLIEIGVEQQDGDAVTVRTGVHVEPRPNPHLPSLDRDGEGKGHVWFELMEHTIQ